MENFGTLPPGIRLDSWPDTAAPKAPQDTAEVAQLREALRKAMPELVSMLDVLAKLRPMQELAGRLAAPQPAKLIIRKS